MLNTSATAVIPYYVEPSKLPKECKCVILHLKKSNTRCHPV